MGQVSMLKTSSQDEDENNDLSRGANSHNILASGNLNLEHVMTVLIITSPENNYKTRSWIMEILIRQTDTVK